MSTFYLSRRDRSTVSTEGVSVRCEPPAPSVLSLVSLLWHCAQTKDLTAWVVRNIRCL